MQMWFFRHERQDGFLIRPFGGNDRCIVAEVVVWACVRHMLGVRQGHKHHVINVINWNTTKQLFGGFLCTQIQSLVSGGVVMSRRRDKAPQASGTRRAARELVFRVMFEADQGNLPLESVFLRVKGDLQAEGLQSTHGAQGVQSAQGDHTEPPASAQNAESTDSPFPRLKPSALDFATELFEGVQKHWPDIDHTLRHTIRGWSFEQMAQTDLNVLRLAVYELKYSGEPHPPIMESAVRIARKFGGDESGRFVNGVLASLSRDLAAQAQRAHEQNTSSTDTSDTDTSDTGISDKEKENE